MADEFELTDEMRSVIGVESEPWPVEVTTTSVRAFARGVGYTDMRYFDEEAPTADGSLLRRRATWARRCRSPVKSDTTFSGPKNAGPALRHGLPGLLDGGTEVVYERPLVAGDRLLMTTKIADLEVKESKGLGKMLVVTSEQEFGTRRPATSSCARTVKASTTRRQIDMSRFDEINVGDQLPVLAKSPDRAQLVLYCAGSGDFNPLHWDQSFPQAQALGDNIVHGRMKWSSLGQLVSDWIGSRRLGAVGVVPVPGHGPAGHRVDGQRRSSSTSARSTVATRSRSRCGPRTPPAADDTRSRWSCSRLVHRPRRRGASSDRRCSDGSELVVRRRGQGRARDRRLAAASAR